MARKVQPSKTPATVLHEGRDRHIWPEQLYRYVEHYFWEPQHLLKTEKARRRAKSRGEGKIEAFYRLIRSQEVPLNFTLNLVLRIVPSSVKVAFLQQFHADHAPLRISGLELLHGEDQPFTQPDVLLQTKTHRFFVELKVKGSTTINQIEKYAQLHAHLNRLDSPRKPYLYFLTPGLIDHGWKPKKERSLLVRDGLQAFARQELKQHKPSLKKLTKTIGPASEESYDLVIESLRIGHATWQMIGDCLCSERDNRVEYGGEIEEMMNSLIGDFLIDLEARGLWIRLQSDSD